MNQLQFHTNTEDTEVCVLNLQCSTIINVYLAVKINKVYTGCNRNTGTKLNHVYKN